VATKSNSRRRDRFIDRRKGRGFTQEGLARMLGVEVSTVRRWEAGATSPQPSLWPAVAKALRITPAELSEILRQAAPQPSLICSSDSEASSPAVSAGSQAEAVRAFRLADQRVGGGPLYTTVMSYLTTHVGPELLAESNTGQAFIAAAGLTEMVGWMAHDAGRDQVAVLHFQRALSLAQVSGAPALIAQAWASRAHLCLHQGRNETSLVASERAWQQLDGSEDPPVRGRVLAMRARAHAALGDPGSCRADLARAERLLTVGNTDSTSAWTSPFDVGSMASEAARSMCDVGDLAAATEYADLALKLRKPDRARARALASLTRARALLGQGEIDQACTIARQVGQSASAIGSLVVAGQLNEVTAALMPYASSSVVATVLPELRGILRQHTGMYHWLGGEAW